MAGKTKGEVRETVDSAISVRGKLVHLGLKRTNLLILIECVTQPRRAFE